MYPIWEVPYLTAGMVLGLVATFHILPSHLSVSAMWLNVYLEWKADREGRPELLSFVRRYSRLILIFCYVTGSLSGVGIWFAATLASPRGLSALIHNYVWGWATEWVFFLIEVAGIFTYYYTLDKLDAKTHMRLGLVFAAASWLTMVVIVGILTFMMTPGAWNSTGAFFDGFFNESYWPQLLFRTTSMFAIAGVYAVVVASREPEGAALAVVVLMSAARESLRVALLGRWGFSVYAHRVTVDWGSTALFFATFLLGASVLAWVLTVAFQAGRTAGRFTAGPRLAAWGKVSLGLLAAWLVVVAGYGVSVTLRNG